MKAIIGIGLPGSGKTSNLMPLAKQLGARYVSPDAVRRSLPGKLTRQQKNAIAWARTFDIIKAALPEQSVVIDAVNARRGERRRIIEACHRAGATKVEGCWFRTLPEVCKERNRRRKPPELVPDEFIDRMAKALTAHPPSRAEGFTKLTKIT